MSRPSITVTFDRARLVAELAAMPDAAKKVLSPWLKRNAALTVSSTGNYKGMVQALPPFRLDAKTSQAQARRYGQKKVAAQIWRVYGGPNLAYKLLFDKAGIGYARRFWDHFKKGEIEQASRVLLMHAGKNLVAFDDGVEHKRRRRNGQVKGKERTLYTTRAKWVNDYVKEKQALVGSLASVLVAPGRVVFSALKGIPPFVERHNLPGGSITHQGDDNEEFYLMTASTNYALNLERRAEGVLSFRIAAMQLELPHVIRAAKLLP